METRPTELGRPTAQGATVGLSDGDRDWGLSVNRFCFASLGRLCVVCISLTGIYRLTVLGYNVGANRPRYGSSIHGSGAYRLIKDRRIVKWR